MNQEIILNEENISYNYFLYRKRIELKLSIKKFAKLLNIRPLHYRLIEFGYIKPNKNDIIRISEYFNIDYNYYLEDIRNYPTELENKKYMKLTNFLYHLFNKRKVRITFLIIAIISLIALTSSLIAGNKIGSTSLITQEENIKELNKGLKEKGDWNFSLFDFKYPQISEVYTYDNYEKAVIIKDINSDTTTDLKFQEIIWTDDYRYVIKYSSYEEDNIYNWMVYEYDYTTGKETLDIITETADEFNISKNYNNHDFVRDYFSHNNIKDDFTNLMHNKLEINTTFEEIINSMYTTKQKNIRYEIVLGITMFVSLVFSCLFSFLFGYAMIYKKERDEKITFSHSDELLDLKPLNKKVKKDIKIMPFIPETVLKIIGILLVVLGTLRAVFYTFNIGNYSQSNIDYANTFYSIQLLGMFIIFFINFDVYMDDNRLFRNLLLYPMVFFLIYVLEASIVESLTKNTSVLSLSLTRVMIPNPFFSATCYFLIMFFLFFTPNYIKTKKRLIVFRSLAIIPILLIFISFFLSNAEVMFNFSYNNYWIKYLFRGDRFPLSILGVTYLVSLFFLRLYYKKKYGEENAFKYFMGNRYIFIKNAIGAGLIIIIWIFEIIFEGNTTLNKMGIGLNTFLIVLAPLVLLYHPHKNARNTKVDITLITIYGISLVLMYAAAGIVALISFVS